MSDRAIAKQKIRRAAEATTEIDKILWEPIQRLRDAGQGSNGAGIYSDLSRMRLALLEASAAIKRANETMNATAWPTNEDYDTAD